jgi:hypothetical protein
LKPYQAIEPVLTDVESQIGISRDPLFHGRWERASEVALGVLDQFPALDSFAVMVASGPKRFPFRYGGTFLDALLFAVPRGIWPEKPRSFSFAIGTLLRTGSDVPPGYIGEWYINFHLPGILLGMYLMGRLLRGAHRWILSGDPTVITIYSILMPYFIIVMGRSGIGGGTMVAILAGALLPLLLYLARPKWRRSGPSPSRVI